MIVAVEGIDGAGKNTLVRALTRRLDGVTVTTFSFPRYDEDIHARLARAALRGEMGDMAHSAYAMATMFALDRADAAQEIRRASERGVVLLDRYVASNAAYTVARTRRPEAAEWVRAFEFDRLGLPAPQLQVLLATDAEESARRARARERRDADRARDAYERDAGLQGRTYRAYVELAAGAWVSEWLVTSEAEDVAKAVRGRLPAG